LQIWEADISHLPIQEKVVYFSFVAEGHPRKIVVCPLHASLQNREGGAGMEEEAQDA